MIQRTTPNSSGVKETIILYIYYFICFIQLLYIFSLDKVLKNVVFLYPYRMFTPLLIYNASILLRCIISA